MSGHGWSPGDISIVSPLEQNGAIPVNRQDQTSETIDSLFNKSISNFSLDSDTGVSTETVLVYTFTAAAGHGIAPSDEVLLLDVVGDRALQCIALGVVGDVITIDRPIDHVYPAASTLGRIVTSEMSVNGSVTPQIFTFRTGVSPVDCVRILLTGLDDNSMDFTKFLGIPALTRGLVFRVVNGVQKTIFNFKTNRDIAQFCYDVNLEEKAPAGQFGFSARITFGGEDKHGVVLRLSGTDVIQFIVQDDLTDLGSLRGSIEGHKVTD